MRMIVWGVLLILAGALVVVRVAPSEASGWHVPVTFAEDRNMTGGAARVRDATDGVLERLDAIARATPRTRAVAGSVQDGRITYVTRSFWIGFPDYTTVEVSDGKLRMFARLRFGRSDLGVNAKRLEGWLAQL